MSPYVRYILIILGLNILAGALLFIAPPLLGHDGMEDSLFVLLILLPAMLLLQLITGIVLLFYKRHNMLGQALLLSMGVILLIGLSVCGVIAF